MTDVKRVSRRSLFRGVVAGGSALAATHFASLPAARADGFRVAVLGGGIAGLTAAHELAERGISVTVYERRSLGGKARSMGVPGSASGGRGELPGEHGFRFFPGIYHNLPDTMRRIPFGDNRNGVWDNMVSVRGAIASRENGADLTAALSPANFTAFTPEAIRESLESFARELVSISPLETSYWSSRMLAYITSCDARRFGQWENQSWRQFVGADTRSVEYQRVLSRGLTTSLVAAKEDTASARTIAAMGENFMWAGLGIGNDGEVDRVLCGPTNEVFIDPWVTSLRALGVNFEVGTEITELTVTNGRVSAAHSTNGPIEADYFICAVPVERARAILTAGARAADPRLNNLDRLVTDWMTGIQFYLRRTMPLGQGHVGFIDSPWALTGLTQNQFWRRPIAASYGDGTVQDCLSVDISDWFQPGILYGKPAIECSPEQVAAETWAQIKAHLNDTRQQISDDDLHSWFIDPGINWDATSGRNTNDDPLLINTAGSWVNRPTARTEIPNLFLAGDYVQTNIDLATMEGANESARAAVNALLDDIGSSAPRCQLHTLYRPRELEPLKAADEARYRAGLPNIFDVG